MNNNYNGNYQVNNVPYQQPMPVQNKKKSFATDKMSLIGYVICALMIAFCFLPLATVSGYGHKESTNYVYYNGKIKDGVFIIIGMIIFILGIVFNKKLRYFISDYVVMLGVFIYDLVDLAESIKEYYSNYNFFDIEMKFGIGVYFLIIGFVALAVYLFLKFKNNNNNNTVQSNNYNQYNYNQNNYNNPQQNQFNNFSNENYNQQQNQSNQMNGYNNYPTNGDANNYNNQFQSDQYQNNNYNNNYNDNYNSNNNGMF